MYGLPKDIDLSFLVGQEIVQIGIGYNDLILNFADQLRILIASEFAYCNEFEFKNTYQYFAAAATSLANLFGQKVVDATGREDGHLTIQFENGHSIELRDDSEKYESYVITYKDRTIVV